jgi:hypothetical protein
LREVNDSDARLLHSPSPISSLRAVPQDKPTAATIAKRFSAMADIVAKVFLPSGGSSYGKKIIIEQFWTFATVSALLGPREMSDLSPQSGPKRTLTRSLSPIAMMKPARPDFDMRSIAF